VPDTLSADGAEEIGIHFGNGYLFDDSANYHAGFDIYGDLYDDYPYLEYYVKPIVRLLYHVEPRTYIHPLSSVVILRTNSKNALYWKRHLGVPVGRKVQLRIPTIIKSQTSLVLPFLRGLFDIEGTVLPGANRLSFLSGSRVRNG
jgi:intein/homing endonuclease